MNDKIQTMQIAQLILDYIKTLIWPTFALACVIMFRKPVAGILPRLRNAELPGGVKLNFDEAIEQARRLEHQILSTPEKQEPDRKVGKRVLLTDANARMVALGLQPSPSGLDFGYYRTLVQQDPNVGLAGLRTELEIMGRNLAKGFNISLSGRDNSAMSIFRKLLDKDAITHLQFQLLKKIIEICNAAIHGERVTKNQAESILDTARILADEYIAWLSWGFPGQ